MTVKVSIRSAMADIKRKKTNAGSSPGRGQAVLTLVDQIGATPFSITDY